MSRSSTTGSTTGSLSRPADVGIAYHRRAAGRTGLSCTCGSPPTRPGGHAGQAAETGTPAMLAAHCLAALLCGLCLWWGEHIAFALAAALYTRIVLLLLPLVPPSSVPAAADVPLPRPNSEHWPPPSNSGATRWPAEAPGGGVQHLPESVVPQ